MNGRRETRNMSRFPFRFFRSILGAESFAETAWVAPYSRPLRRQVAVS